MNYDPSCDAVIAVGSGVINDTGKILAATGNKPYIIVGTAPSMDGYASATSSMTRGGLKISLPSKSADVIVGDLDILKNAPMHMLVSGLGDMLAKYISICEWRIANLITGEYYCEEIAGLVRTALKKCVDNAKGLLERNEEAVKAVFEGLVIGGIAMTYAGVSRPASGVEHYFSHVWDMRGVEFGEKVELHGIQCAVGTLLAAKYYEKLKAIKPNKEKALAYATAFDYSAYSAQLTEFLGKGARSMRELEKTEGKYDLDRHAKRIDIIIANWDRMLKIIDEEIPASAELDELFSLIGAPKTVREIGIDPSTVPFTFKATKDIRDKYVLSRLCWDLGIIDEI
jgi:glycerol-1-phosphate dehydrogenase [NAD(P)+]